MKLVVGKISFSPVQIVDVKPGRCPNCGHKLTLMCNNAQCEVGQIEKPKKKRKEKKCGKD